MLEIGGFSLQWGRYLVSFWAGVLSFFSPCILPLIPVYICFITGLSYEELADKKNIIKSVFPNAILFILGFSIVFVVLGATATFISSFLFANRNIIRLTGGIIVILFGLHMSGLFNIRFLQVEKRLHLKGKSTNIFGSFLLGIAFGFGWTPCVGPMLGSILILAASRETLAQGILLLGFYSLGIALPFLLMAMGIGWVLKVFSRIKKYFRLVSATSGILLIIMGVWLLWGSWK